MPEGIGAAGGVIGRKIGENGGASSLVTATDPDKSASHTRYLIGERHARKISNHPPTPIRADRG